MPDPNQLVATLDGLEIGATGPSELQLVLNTGGHSVALKLTADEAVWLAAALKHWADQSQVIRSN